MKKPIRNMAASVRARLLKRAKEEGRPFDELLMYHAMERFLFRLSQSEHGGLFVLKGALMLRLWGGPLSRATKDIDLLGLQNRSVAELEAAVKRCLAMEVADDGLRFDAASVSGEAIRLAAHYDGVRIRFNATLGSARARLQVDVGFGDVITPGAVSLVYPTLLDFEAPKLAGYTRETAIAEKLEAMVVLDMANTRMKDFLDIWLLAMGHPYAGPQLAAAVRATFERRRTPLPNTTPVALTPAFHGAPAKSAQWKAFLRKARVAGDIPSFPEVAEGIERFVMPVFSALTRDVGFEHRWEAGGPWIRLPNED